jgi:hypothetical protein
MKSAGFAPVDFPIWRYSAELDFVSGGSLLERLPGVSGGEEIDEPAARAER